MTALVHWPGVSRLAMSLEKTYQSMIEAATCMFHTLLAEASDDLERVTPQSRESLHIETTRNQHRCSRSKTPSEKPRSRSRTLVEKSEKQTPTDGTPMLVPILPSPPDRSGTCAVKLEPLCRRHNLRANQ